MVLLGLFLNAFVAATLLPAWSEAALAGLMAAGKGAPALLFLAATSGNVLGSLLNWWLGSRVRLFQDRRWFPFSEGQIERGQRLFRRFGTPALLLAWVPIIGDPLTLAAGIFRVPIVPFLVFVTIGKAFRYALVIAGVGAMLA
ncbi:MAG: DedA family protein [Alphaproteobacteria bacterium]|nr:MAG: DedA family protein [Alphaproteobacteria bacterium]